jgi:methylphosphonate synthase
MREGDSRASSRIFNRGGAAYYEYRDTAMSRIAPFRPEWILELAEVADSDPENPVLQWNNGHFMHQFTMFVGAVNFYYIEGGRKKVLEANTGDSMYITPFVPHTFATRREDSQKLYGGKKGLILALTYGNKLFGDAQQELSAVGVGLCGGYKINTGSAAEYFGSLLRAQLDSMSVGRVELAKRSGLDTETRDEFLAGKKVPVLEDYKKLAGVFSISIRDLMPPDEFDPPVVTRFFNDSEPREYDNYLIRDLAGARYLSYSKSLHIEVKGPAKALNLSFPLHEYCYNFGNEPVLLRWSIRGTNHEERLNPGDSAYLKPNIPHSLGAQEGLEAKILSLRIGGKIMGDAQRELAQIGSEHLDRICEESMLWYKEEK